MAKQLKIPHVKLVRSKGKTYAYFNTGRKVRGKVVYLRLPDLADTGFWASYAAFKAGRTKRAQVAYTIAALAHDYEASPQFKERATNTQIFYVKIIRRIVAELGKFPVDDLKRSDLRLVLDGPLSALPGMHNAFVKLLAVLYAWGRQRDLTTLEPTKGIAMLAIGSHEPWPDDILEAALAADDATVRLAVHLLYFTGQRIGDICALRWSDARNGKITVVQQKTGKRVRMPMHSDLAAELDKAPRRGITVLTDAAGRPLTQQTLRRALKAFTTDLGAETVPHGLRKNAVNALLEAGCSVAEVSAITGQSYALVEHYAARVNTDKLASAAMLKFENRGGTGKRSAKQSEKGG